MAELTGPAAAVASLLELARLPDGTQTLGPIAVPAPPGALDDTPASQVLLRAPRAELAGLARALHAAAALRSARRDPGSVRIQIDPPNPG